MACLYSYEIDAVIQVLSDWFLAAILVCHGHKREIWNIAWQCLSTCHHCAFSQCIDVLSYSPRFWPKLVLNLSNFINNFLILFCKIIFSWPKHYVKFKVFLMLWCSSCFCIINIWVNTLCNPNNKITFTINTQSWSIKN